MPKPIEDLLRPNIRELQPYASARDEFSGEAYAYLDANENAWGTVGQEAAYNRYPDPLQRTLKERLATLEGVKAEQIFVGNGSDEAIDLLIRAFCEPQRDRILLCPPTYGMYKVSAAINHVEIREVPLRVGYQLDVNALSEVIEDDPYLKLLFLCSPNNPTANTLRREDMQQVIAAFPGIVAVDEAYIDFCPEKTLLDLIDQHSNLVILRTFSKAWGLAGARLGMAYASEEIIRVLNRIKPPYNVNSLSQEAALKALSEVEKKNAWVAEALQQRTELAQALAALSWVEKVYPSDANFLLVKLPQADEVYRFLIEQGIVVRNRSRVTLCEGCLRVTVGLPPENRALLVALAVYYEKQPSDT